MGKEELREQIKCIAEIINDRLNGIPGECYETRMNFIYEQVTRINVDDFIVMDAIYNSNISVNEKRVIEIVRMIEQTEKEGGCFELSGCIR
ncbi:hypothetical protein ACWG0P_10880 [Amedibacillus sp. YH-ame6]